MFQYYNFIVHSPDISLAVKPPLVTGAVTTMAPILKPPRDVTFADIVLGIVYLFLVRMSKLYFNYSNRV